MFYTHERPSWEPSCSSVVLTFCSQYTFDTTWAADLHLNITPSSMFDPNFHIDVLQVFKIIAFYHLLRNGYRTFDTLRSDELPAGKVTLAIHCAIVESDGVCRQPSLWLNERPRLGGFNECVSVECAIAVLVAVESASCSLFPILIICIHNTRCFNTEILNVTPCKVRAAKRLVIDIIYHAVILQPTELVELVRKPRQHLVLQQTYHHVS